MLHLNNPQKRVALAPMAGVGDTAFRELCSEFGAAFVVSEMISAKGIVYSNKNTLDLMTISNKEQPCIIQLFGNDPSIMKEAAKKAAEFNPAAIDVNMGCPVPKVTSIGCGSALMKSPKLCGEIVQSIKNAVNIPVTVKIRKGWDENNINATEIAKICEDAGAGAITIHARTKKEMYSFGIDLNIIREVKNSVKIPVIGNGDIKSADDADTMIKQTGCDMVMIGRAALGNPWIFKEINTFLNTGITIEKPSIEEKLSVMIKHIRKICEYKGEYLGIREARKHIAWYIKGIKNAASFRNLVMSLNSFSELLALTEEILNQNIS